MRTLNLLDQILINLDAFVHTALKQPSTHLPTQFIKQNATPLSVAQTRAAAALMRVNHVGEICAQALYRAQAMATSNPELRQKFELAAREEKDHLDWTYARISQLGGRVSFFNPLWYGGAFTIGWVTGHFGDKTSLSFMAETERQVEKHLDSHLYKLPETDFISRAIVQQMKNDEMQHATRALKWGGEELPDSVKKLMALAAKFMTTTAYFI